MRVFTTQFKIKHEFLCQFEDAMEDILSALSRTQNNGVHYILCRPPDGASFIGWLELDDGVENPLPKLAAGREFMDNLQNWVAEPPKREELHVIGTYRSIRGIPSEVRRETEVNQ